MGESVIAFYSLALISVITSRDAHVGTWWFETVIVGTELDPVLFTKILNDCSERLQPTLNKSSIFAYACREHNTVLVAARQVAIEDFLKCEAPINWDSGHFKDAYSKITRLQLAMPDKQLKCEAMLF